MKPSKYPEGVNSAPMPAADDLCRLSVCEYLTQRQMGNISAVDYALSCANQVERAEEYVGAWAWYDRERFLSDAEQRSCETESAGRQYAATGAPLAVKDIFNTADMPTNHGSPIFDDYSPGNDARVVTSMRRAGAVVMGKTVTAELAVHTPGKTRNPIDLSRSCGTSSSGSAAAVAAFMAPWALSSQTAGSTIRPASYCGIYGFKPSFGLLPRTAMLKTTDTLDSVGLMARSVADLLLMFEITRVRGPNYPVVDKEMNDPARAVKRSGDWRVGIVAGPKSGLEAPAVKTGLEDVARILASAGCHVEEFTLAADYGAAHAVHETIYRRALAYYFKLEWGKYRSQFSDALAEMIEGGLSITPEDYHAALQSQIHMAAMMDQALKNYDVIISPATADEAPVGADAPDVDDHNLIWTMCYLPSLSIPKLKGTTGFPVGLQIASRRFNDYIALDFAAFADRLIKECN